jgi:hypothetical protein
MLVVLARAGLLRTPLLVTSPRSLNITITHIHGGSRFDDAFKNHCKTSANSLISGDTEGQAIEGVQCI